MTRRRGNNTHGRAGGSRQSPTSPLQLLAAARPDPLVSQGGEQVQRAQSRWSASARFPPVPASVRAARCFVLAELGRIGPLAAPGTPDAEALALLTSELASNAVRHARTPFTVTLLAQADGLRVAVADGAPGQPRPGAVPSGGEGGRGLALLGRLARAWGVVDHAATRPTSRDLGPVPGKTVWFVLGWYPLPGGTDPPAATAAPTRRAEPAHR
jgi:anti-sigma regulatory factor (Ser/Thr protein kinase)